MPPLLPIVLVSLGGAAGSALRYVTGLALAKSFGPTMSERFPFGTLAVNVLGCAAIGFLAVLWSGTTPTHTNLRLLCLTGFLGGFTTFSAFGLETHRLLTRGETTLALANIALNVIVGLAAVGVGMRVGRAMG